MFIVVYFMTVQSRNIPLILQIVSKVLAPQEKETTKGSPNMRELSNALSQVKEISHAE